MYGKTVDQPVYWAREGPAALVTPRAVTDTEETVPVRRSYKFRMRPTARQHVALQQCLDAHRELYNAALQERRDAWRKASVSITFAQQSADLPYIREARPDIARWGSGSEQATLRKLDQAMQAFFRRVKAGKAPGYPRFKSKDRFGSVVWPSPGDACRWKPDQRRVYLRGIGDVKVTAHRPIAGVVKTIQVKREGRHWFLVLSCDGVPIRPLEPTGAVVGLDVGIASFVATSDGELIDNPRHGRRGAARLAGAQRRLAMKRRGSANGRHAKATIGVRHRKIRRQRLDFHHKLARRLVTDHDVLAVEKLIVANMTRSASGTLAEPGTNVAAKSGLNRSISDAGWAQFLSILTGKAEEAGRQVIAVNPRHTSQRCAECGHVDKGNRVTQAEFRCLACGHQAHADVNAARNILRAGLALLDAQAS